MREIIDFQPSDGQESGPSVDPLDLRRYGAVVFAMTSGEYATKEVARFLELHQQRTEDLRAAGVITDLSVIDSSATGDFPITVEKGETS